LFFVLGSIFGSRLHSDPRFHRVLLPPLDSHFDLETERVKAG